MLPKDRGCETIDYSVLKPSKLINHHKQMHASMHFDHAEGDSRQLQRLSPNLHTYRLNQSLDAKALADSSARPVKRRARASPDAASGLHTPLESPSSIKKPAITRNGPHSIVHTHGQYNKLPTLPAAQPYSLRDNLERRSIRQTQFRRYQHFDLQVSPSRAEKAGFIHPPEN